jgi:hypothetical protein
VVVYDPAEIGALGAEMLTGLVKDLNALTRPVSISAPRAPISAGSYTTTP